MGQKMLLPVRTALMIGGIVLIGISVALFRLAGFGVDPFTGMNLGISTFLGWSFGNWQLLANTLILAVVFFTVRSCIGLGTLVNMVCVGYIADFICWLVQEALTLTLGIPVRILLLPAALLFASSGVALYMKADMGIAPYDSVAVDPRENSLSHCTNPVRRDRGCHWGGILPDGRRDRLVGDWSWNCMQRLPQWTGNSAVSKMAGLYF